jgi:hypothetical protein
LAVAIWCAAVARASASLAYLRFPLTGHFDSLSTTRLPSRLFHSVQGKPIIRYYKAIRQMPNERADLKLNRCPEF